MSYEPIPNEELAAIVTYLEMTERPVIEPPRSTLDLKRITTPSVERYRELFRLVGAPWLWFSRLIMAVAPQPDHRQQRSQWKRREQPAPAWAAPGDLRDGGDDQPRQGGLDDEIKHRAGT